MTTWNEHTFSPDERCPRCGKLASEETYCGDEWHVAIFEWACEMAHREAREQEAAPEQEPGLDYLDEQDQHRRTRSFARFWQEL